MSAYDLVVRGGTVVDGSGAEPVSGDVAVLDGKVAAVGKVDGRGANEIDAKGRIVTPGFIDVHTHYDGQAIWSDRLNPSSSHGVTTVLMGNCGVGFAPCRPADHDLLVKVMEGVEDIPGVVMTEGLPWTWETFPQYLAALESQRRDIDVAAYLPHNPLRVYVMGEAALSGRPATNEELARMRALAAEAMRAGAIGFATSRLSIHRTADGAHVPSFDVEVAELNAIAGGMMDGGGGIMQMVFDAYRDWSSEFDVLLAVLEANRCPATFTLATGNGGPPRWQPALDKMTLANAKGAAITAQVFPRPIGMLMGHELSINPFVLYPSYRAIAALSLADKVRALREPALRRALLAETPAAGHPLAAVARDWNWIFPVRDPPDYEPALDQSVAAQAAARGTTPEEFAYDFLLGGDGKAMLYLSLGNFHDGNLDIVREFLERPDCIVGLGDGGAHYRAICDASFPTFMLRHWARERKTGRLPLAKVVHMLSQKPAAAVGLEDRGLLRPGFKADINVIDMDRLILHAPEVVRDLPAGGARLDQRATGFDATIVAGQIIRRFDEATAARPGALVRGAGYPRA